MAGVTDDMLAELPCHECGYDLRAHPREGRCPECGASVAESARVAAIPRRPAWRDSDPRWRRRMLAGAWALVLLPLMDALLMFELASRVPVANVFGFPGTVRTLNETFLAYPRWYATLVFCIGVVLLFSKERGRRRAQLDWTRRWGVLGSYVVLLLSAAMLLFVPALVLVGISAVFLSMPLKYQPTVTQVFIDVSTAYLRYGPYPKEIAAVVLVAFSSITVLLACVALFEALGSSGPRRLAAILLAPLVLFSLMHLAQAAIYSLGISIVTSEGIYLLGTYFRPVLLVGYLAGASQGWTVGAGLGAWFVEATKWCVVLAIAVWLSIAQFAAWRQKRKPAVGAR